MFTVVGWAWLASGVAGAQASVEFPAESYVRIAELRDSDAFYGESRVLVGSDCRVQQQPLQPRDGGWWAGGLACDNGTSYQFAWVRVIPLRSDTVPSVPERSVIRVTAIDAEDAHAADAASVVGRNCVVTGTFSRTEGSFWGGPAQCDDELQYYFYKVAFDVVDLAVAPRDTAAWQAGVPVEPMFSDPVEEVAVEPFDAKPIRRGRRVVIYGISDADAFARYREVLEGRICRVRKGKLKPSAPGYYSGTLQCEGVSLLFYQVDVQPYRR